MIPEIEFDESPYRLSGTVYGALLNHKQALAALGESVHEAPYKAPPKAPVLYVKPKNTLNSNNGAVVVPANTAELQIGATLGLVVGKVACAVKEQEALSYLAGYTTVIDFSVPHESFYRPSVRFKALDTSCVIGPRVVSQQKVNDPNNLALKVYVDGELKQVTSTGGMVRNVSQLLADVTEFMTLQPGDVLLLGVAAGAVTASAGQKVKVELEEVGVLETELVKEVL